MQTKLLSRLENLNVNKWLLATYVLTVVVSLFLSTPLFLFIILIYPAAFIFDINKNNLLLTLPILILLNIAVFIVTAAILELTGSPINVTSLTLANLLLAVGVLYLLSSKRLQKLRLTNTDWKIMAGLYGVFSLAVIARVVSVLGAEVPITHDPISHAFWAKGIAENQTIDYFYPPGLHILIAFVSESLQINYALSTLYVTNLFNAFSVLSWSAVALAITKNRTFSILVAVLMVIVPYPAVLFYIAGKNAFIASLAFMPIVFYTLYRFIKNFNLRNSLLLSLALSGLFIIYYPSFIYLSLFVAVITVIKGVDIVIKSGNLKTYLASLSLVAVIVAGISGGWLLTTWDSYIERGSNIVVFEDEKLNTEMAETVIKLPTAVDFVNAARVSAGQIKSGFDQYNTILFPLTLAALFIVAIAYRRLRYLAIPVFAATIFSVLYMRNLFEISGISIITTTGEFLFFSISAISVAAAGAFILKKAKLDTKRIVLVIALLAFTLSLAVYGQYSNYSNRVSGYSFVDKSDVEAFSWINQNIEPEAGFIVDAKQHSRRERIIFPIGGGAWMPVYTNNEITTPFQEERFGKQETHDNYGLYLQIEENSKLALCSLRNRGFRYYYQDLDSWDVPFFSLVDIAPSEIVEEIYSNSGVGIYEINQKYCR